MKCPYCGFESTEPSHFCAECGRDLTIPAPETAESTPAFTIEPAPASVEETAQTISVPMMESAAGGTTTVYHGVLDKKPDKKSRWATIGVWGWIGIFILLSIPLVNLILLLVWSFGGANRQVLQSFARATLILGIVSAILVVVGFILLYQFAPMAFESFGTMFAY